MLSPALSLALGGCATSSSELDDPFAPLPEVSIEEFSSVTADLDFGTATASTPLDPYLVGYSFEIETAFAQARATITGECLRGFGYASREFATVDWETLQPLDDRQFGMWDVRAAAKFGFEPDGSRGVPQPSPALNAGQGYADASAVCAGKRQEDPRYASILRDLEGPQFLSDRIQGNAMALALASPEGSAATERFADCLRARGLVLDPDSGYVSSEYTAKGKEAEIVAALGEAECNRSSGRVQTLYDLRARYEAAYMERYESQLDAVAEQKRSILDRLEALIGDQHAGPRATDGAG